MPNDCLFCSIAADPSKLIWENGQFAVFKDIHPKAPVHVLVVPKRHVVNLDDLDDSELAAGFLSASREVAAKIGVAGAYRFHVNNGRAAGQEIDHLHAHLLGKIRPDSFDKLREDGL